MSTLPTPLLSPLYSWISTIPVELRLILSIFENLREVPIWSSSLIEAKHLLTGYSFKTWSLFIWRLEHSEVKKLAIEIVMMPKHTVFFIKKSVLETMCQLLVFICQKIFFIRTFHYLKLRPRWVIQISTEVEGVYSSRYLYQDRRNLRRPDYITTNH